MKPTNPVCPFLCCLKEDSYWQPSSCYIFLMLVYALTRSVCPIIRVSSDTLLLHRSRIEAVWNAAEAAGTAAAQQEEVTWRAFQRTWLLQPIWLTLLCPNIPLTRLPPCSLLPPPPPAGHADPQHGVCRGARTSTPARSAHAALMWPS